MKVSKTGYRKDSKDKNEPALIIPSNSISMKNTDQYIIGIDDTGMIKIMKPGEDYMFRGSKVVEIPLGHHRMPDGSVMSDDEMKRGGQKKGTNNKGFKALPKNIQEKILSHLQAGGQPPIPDSFQMNDPFGEGDVLQKFLNGGPKGPIKVLDRTAYNDSLSRYNQTNATEFDVTGSPEFLPTADVMGSLGFKPLVGVKDKYPVYTKNGKVVIKHPEKNDFIYIGEESSLKFKGVPGSQTTPQVTPTVASPTSSSIQTGSLESKQDPNRKPLDFSNPNYVFDPNTGKYLTNAGQAGSEIAPIVQQFRLGGLSKFLRSQAPQGKSMEDILQNKTTEFVDYLSANYQDALFKEEILNFQKGFAQKGQQINDPLNSLSGLSSGPQPGEFWLRRDHEIPKYVEGIVNENNPLSMQELSTPYKYGTEDQSAMFDRDYQERMNELDVQEKAKLSEESRKKDLFNKFADTYMVTAQAINSLAANTKAKQEEEFNKKKLAIENQIASNFGSMGDYDRNTGAFRINEKTPAFQQGGSYFGDFAETNTSTRPQNNISKYPMNGLPRNHYGRPLYFTHDPWQDSIPTPERDVETNKFGFDFGNSGLLSAPMFKKGGQKPSYKKGGEYSLDKDEIARLLREGYTIQFAD